ncbi:MAG: WGR domain-containing protein [Planctomycetes bacterium]|nr:WGR domain-containing protein [Planctomycetota bacterium]
MPRREFQFIADKSAKFWTIDWDDCTFTVHFGRIGTKGQSQTKTLSNAAELKKACDKLIAEKLGKGYVETGSTASAETPGVASGTAMHDKAADVHDRPAEPPERSIIQEALKILGASEQAVAAFPDQAEDLAFSFANALADAPATIYTDWRFHPAEVLNDVWQRLFPHGVKGMIEEDDPDTGFPKTVVLQHAGIGSRYRVRLKGKEPCLHDLLFALEKVLPADLKILSLRPYEATDTCLHVVQPASKFASIRELLGPWFWKVFATHVSSSTFTKTGGNVKPKHNLIKNHLKNAKQWFVNMEDFHREHVEKIENVLKRCTEERFEPRFVGMTREQMAPAIQRWREQMATPRRLLLITLAMESVGKRIIEEGVTSVLQGRPEGWPRIHLALQYEVWSIHLQRHMGKRQEIDQIPDHGGRLLALAWSLGDLSIVRWLGEAMLKHPEHFSWHFTPLEPYLLQLYALWKNIEINWANYPKAKLGVYQQIFSAWEDPAKLSVALEMCCDYHLLRTGESGYQEFSWSPYDIFPVEILAVHRVRELLGLPTPMIAHALMDSPLGKLPSPVHSPPDELLQRILDAIVQDAPELLAEVEGWAAVQKQDG